MSRENVEVVRQVFEAFNSEDIEVILALTHTDFELEVPPSVSAEPDVYRGHDGMRRYWESFQDAMDVIRIHPERLDDAGESVVVAMHLTAKGRSTGISVEQRSVGVWRIRDAKVIRIRAFASRAEALLAVGLTD
jgi:ketosteroid isomerase-like protein